MNNAFLSELEKIAASKCRTDRRPIRADTLTSRASVRKDTGQLKTAQMPMDGMSTRMQILERFGRGASPEAWNRMDDMLAQVMPAFKRSAHRLADKAKTKGRIQGAGAGLGVGGAGGLAAGMAAGGEPKTANLKAVLEAGKQKVPAAVELGKKYWRPGALVAGGSALHQAEQDRRLGSRVRAHQGG